jgi:hypothetical protein
MNTVRTTNAEKKIFAIWGHSRENGNQGLFEYKWMPACAGMTNDN